MTAAIVGLTGGIGSGKSFIADCFATHNIDIVDADIVAREVVAPGTFGLNEIVNKFGDEILTPDGKLDRPKLREIVFADQTLTAWLNQCLHPLIRDKMRHDLNAATSPYVIFVVPLLIENKLHTWCQRVCVVDVPEALQVERAMCRDGNTAEQIKQIMAQQCSRNERLAHADDIIDNSQSRGATKDTVKNLHEFYMNSGFHLNSKAN